MSIEELSAGGVVVRGDELLVVVPQRRSAKGERVLALPKGHLDPGETAQQAAVREVREEGGVDVEVVESLGDVRYWYRRPGSSRAQPKRVSFFLCRYLSGDPSDHDDEIEDARWMAIAEACRALSYEGEREVAARAMSRIAAAR